MGALVAFETVRQLRRMGAALPDLLILSAHRAPHLQRSRPPLHRLPDADFDAKLAGYSGTPDEVLQDPEIMDLFRPLLRRDFAACETYHFTEEPPLPIPALCVGGTEDFDVLPEDLSAWSPHFIPTLRLQLLPGGHFYFADAAPDLHAHIRNVISQISSWDVQGTQAA